MSSAIYTILGDYIKNVSYYKSMYFSLNNNQQTNIFIITKTDHNLKISQIILFNPQNHSARPPFNQLANYSLRMQLTYLMYDFKV